jgi:hypothetical protein
MNVISCAEQWRGVNGLASTIDAHLASRRSAKVLEKVEIPQRASKDTIEDRRDAIITMLISVSLPWPATPEIAQGVWPWRSAGYGEEDESLSSEGNTNRSQELTEPMYIPEERGTGEDKASIASGKKNGSRETSMSQSTGTAVNVNRGKMNGRVVSWGTRLTEDLEDQK